MWFTDSKDQVNINNNIFDSDKGTLMLVIVIFVILGYAVYKVRKYLKNYIRKEINVNNIV